MTVTNVAKDPEALTLTLDAEFEATPDRVWQLWADPRQLERWWGPPNYPATFTELDLRPGTRAAYYMTTPEGDTPAGYWDILEVEPPHRIHMRDGFANRDGSPNTDMGTGEMVITIEPLADGKTRMSIKSVFPDAATMEQLLEMGQEEGLTEAVGQIDAILAEDR
jgi:uncharacterized protein YndB with AHSA1/START domain